MLNGGEDSNEVWIVNFSDFLICKISNTCKSRKNRMINFHVQHSAWTIIKWPVFFHLYKPPIPPPTGLLWSKHEIYLESLESSILIKKSKIVTVISSIFVKKTIALLKAFGQFLDCTKAPQPNLTEGANPFLPVSAKSILAQLNLHDYKFQSECTEGNLEI